MGSHFQVEKINDAPVTEEQIRQWADGAERGYDLDHLRKRGRKPSATAPAR